MVYTIKINDTAIRHYVKHDRIKCGLDYRAKRLVIKNRIPTTYIIDNNKAKDETISRGTKDSVLKPENFTEKIINPLTNRTTE